MYNTYAVSSANGTHAGTEKYSRGRRGAPAKGVGRVYRRESSNLSFSAKQKPPGFFTFRGVFLVLQGFLASDSQDSVLPIISYCTLFYLFICSQNVVVFSPDALHVSTMLSPSFRLAIRWRAVSVASMHRSLASASTTCLVYVSISACAFFLVSFAASAPGSAFF